MNRGSRISMKLSKIITMVFMVLCLVCTPTVSADSSWWDGSWLNSVNVTINSSQVDSDLTDFVLLVSGTDLNLTGAQVDGDDFVFVNSTNDILPHEIEHWDDTTGEHIFWVKVPFINSSADTIIKLYFGNAYATDQQNSSETWSDYKAVYHMDDATTSTVNDSTGTYIGNKLSSNNPIETTGKIGQAQHFSDDWVNTSMYFGNIDDYSYMIWYNHDDTPSDYEYILSQRSTNQHNLFCRVYTTGYPVTSDERLDTFSSTEYTTDMSGSGWVFLARTSARSDVAYMYIDDNPSVSEVVSDNQLGLDSVVTAHIGSQSSYAGAPSGFFDGMIDEVRIATEDIWTEAEINATYRNTDSPSTFTVMGDMETQTGDTYEILTLTLNSPADFYSSQDTTQDINISIIGNASLYSCIVYFNGSDKGSDGTVSNDTDTILTTSTLDVGTYDWYVNCTTLGDIKQSEIRTLTILETLPDIRFVSPTAGTGATIYDDYVMVNITVSEDELDTFIFNWNGTNYTIFDDTLKLGMNFNNNVILGDTAVISKDISSYSIDGTIEIAEWTARAMYGKSLHLDAIGNVQSDYMNVGNDANLDITQDIVIEFWVRPQEFKNNIILGKYDGTASADDSYWFNIVDFDTLQFCLRSADGLSSDCASYTLPSVMDIGTGFSETGTNALQGVDTDGTLFYVGSSASTSYDVERRYYDTKSIESTDSFSTSPVHCNSITIEGEEMITGCYDQSDNDPNTIRRYYKDNATFISELDITNITNITSCEGTVFWNDSWWVYGAGKNVIAQFNSTWDFVDEYFIEKNLYYKASPTTGGFGKEGWLFWTETIDGVERTFAGGGFNTVLSGGTDFYEWTGTGFELIGLNMMSTSYNAEGWNIDPYNGSLAWMGDRNDAKIYDIGLSMAQVPFWYHVIGMYNGTDVQIYVNDVAGVSTPKTDMIRDASGSNLFVGSDNVGGNEFKGMIDNFMIYNRSFSEAEVNIHYESSFEKDNSAFYRFLINKTILDDSIYTFYSCAMDTNSVMNCTDTRTISTMDILDTIAPEISFTAPTPDDSVTVQTAYITVNLSIIEDSLDTVILSWNGVNETMSGTEVTKVFGDDGLYTYYACANDTLDNVNCTETRTVTSEYLSYLVYLESTETITDAKSLGEIPAGIILGLTENVSVADSVQLVLLLVIIGFGLFGYSISSKK